MANDLTPKQERFAKEYVIDLNGTQAAIRAGYSSDSAKEQASALLTKPNIVEFIAQLQEEIGDRLEITADMVVQELAKIGFANTIDFVSDDNKIGDISKLKRSKVAAVSAVKTTETSGDWGTKTTVELKFHDKVSALEKIGRHLGIFEKDNEQSRLTLPDVIAPGKKDN